MCGASSPPPRGSHPHTPAPGTAPPTDGGRRQALVTSPKKLNINRIHYIIKDYHQKLYNIFYKVMYYQQRILKET